MDQFENEIVNSLQLYNMALKLEVMADYIQTGDAYHQIACIEQFPYIAVNQGAEMRNEALKEYLELLIKVFIISCNLILDSTEDVLLDSINSSVVHVCNVIASRKVKVQLLPIAKPLYDSYCEAYAKLLKNGLKDNAANLERLKKSIFHG